MVVCRHLALLVLVCCLCGCVAPSPTWRAKAASIVEELEHRNARNLFPVEYHNLMETFEHGEALIYVKKNEQLADSYYLFTVQKGAVLQNTIRQEEQRRAEVARVRAAEEAARAAEELLQQQARDAEERLQLQEEQQRVAEQKQPRTISSSGSLPSKEIHQNRPVSYTVRRGETLPQIAARAEIYNDASLWPLIYRANRDQVRDPKRLWPGQVLSIPRVTSSKK